LFANPSVEQLSRLITSTTEQEAYTSITPLEEQSDYAVSSAQRRLWVLSRFEGANEAYNIPQVVRLEGEVSETAFTTAYQDLLTRHEVLRTIFTEDAEGNPRQRILSSSDKLFTIQIEDYSNLPKEEITTRIESYVQQTISSGFDLEQGPLIRCSLLKERENSYVWVLVMHHIVSDGWSMGVLHREFSELYNAAVEARTPDLSPLSIQYKDYASWHNAQLQSESINIHKAYWLEQFKGELPVLELPSDKPRPKVMTYNGASVYRELDKSTTEKLRAFSQEQGGTMFMTFQTALNILLHKYTGQEDIVIGSPIAGREHPDLEGQIGFYVNTLALRNQFTKDYTVTELYQKVKHNTLGAYNHQLYPFENLVQLINPPRINGRNPLFDVWLDYQVVSNGYKLNNLNSNITFLENLHSTSRFDLLWSIEEKMGCLKITLSYKTAVLDFKSVNMIFNLFYKILENFNEIKSEMLKSLHIADGDIKIINQNFHNEKQLRNISKLKNILNEK
jgi:hypothetical protein